MIFFFTCLFFRDAFAIDCVFQLSTGRYDLSTLGVVSFDDAMFEYKLNPCHEVSDSRCSTSAAALQMNSRGCSVLGHVSSRSVSELHRLIEGGVGISFLLGGGSLCYNKHRSVRIDVICDDIDVDTVSSISEGRSHMCGYAAIIKSRSGCPIECPRDELGEVCGGTKRGVCSLGRGGNTALCNCHSGYEGRDCTQQIVESFYWINLDLAGFIKFDSFCSFVVLSLLLQGRFKYNCAKYHSMSFYIFLFIFVVLYPSDFMIRQVNTPRSESISFSNISMSEPLLVIYGNHFFWEEYSMKQFIQILGYLVEKGWSRYVPSNEHWVTSIDNMITSFGRSPDVILLLEDYNVLNPENHLYNRHLLHGTQIICWFDDVVRKTKMLEPPFFSQGLLLSMSQLLLPTYEYVVNIRMPDAAHVPRVWMPHSTTSQFLLPFNTDPVYTILLAGTIDPDVYPMRSFIFDKMNHGDERFEHYQSPGYFPGKSSQHANSFASAINDHVACIIDASTNQFVVAKVFEVMATGSLLLVTDDILYPLIELGLHHGKHFISYNITTLDSIVDWVLLPENKLLVEDIRRRGQDLVRNNHLTTHRADCIHAVGLMAARAKYEGTPYALNGVKRFRNFDEWSQKPKYLPWS